MKTKNAELRLATRLRIGQRIAEAGRRRINLHDVAIALGVTERTIRNWRKQAKEDVPKMGRPSLSKERIDEARKLVFVEMSKHGAPGWRPISVILKDKVSVRLVQKFVSEYKFIQRQKKTSKRIEVVGKNVIWTMDGAITKEAERIENQVIKDRGTKYWVGHKRTIKASNSLNVVETLKESFAQNGLPLVLSTDNGAAYTNKEVCLFLRNLKIVHLKSLPRTPQHNGSVEVGIKELREIMENNQIILKDAIEVANARPRKYGRSWQTSLCVFKNSDVLYNNIWKRML